MVSLQLFSGGEVVPIDLEGLANPAIFWPLSSPVFGVGSTTNSKLQCQTDLSITAGD